MLSFRFHSSWFGRFCKNILPCFDVFPDLKVASLWVSVLHLHTSLTVCNRDMPSPHSSAQTAERRHPPTSCRSPIGSIVAWGFSCTTFSWFFTGGVSCLNLSVFAKHKVSQFISSLKVRAFLLKYCNSLIREELIIARNRI